MSFRERVLALNAKTVASRAELYALLDGFPHDDKDFVDQTSKLPRDTMVVHRGPIRQTQLTAQFRPTAHPELGYEGDGGMSRLVWEAKAWTFEPYDRGWRSVRGTVRHHPRLQLESYLIVIATWGLRHRNLAAMGAAPRLPDLALASLSRLVMGGVPPAENQDVIREVGEGLVDAILTAHVDATPTSQLNRIRPLLAGLVLHGTLDDEASKLISAIGKFMKLAATDSEQSHPLVIATLEDASRVLRTRQEQE